MPPVVLPHAPTQAWHTLHTRQIAHREDGLSRKGWVLFVALCIMWGVPYLFIRIAAGELAPSTIVLVRVLPAILVLAPVAIARGEFLPAFRRWRWMLAYTLIELTIPWLLLGSAEQHITSSMTGLLLASVPLLSAVSYRLLGAHDPLDARRLAGMIVGFAGVAVLVGIDVGGEPVAVAQVIVVALCFAIGPLVVSVRLDGLPIYGIASVSLLMSGIIVAPTGIAQLPATVSPETVVAMVLLAVVCTILPQLVFVALVREVGPSRSTVVTYINPLVAVLAGVVVLGEPFTKGIGLSLPLILAGSVLATAPALRGRRDGGRS